MRDFFYDLVFPIIWLIVGVSFVVSLLIGGIASVDYLDCKGFHNGTGYETRWWWGCYAKVEGKWIPKEYVFGRVNELRLKKQKETK